MGELEPTLDGCSQPIYMNEGIPYGSRTESALRVRLKINDCCILMITFMHVLMIGVLKWNNFIWKTFLLVVP